MLQIVIFGASSIIKTSTLLIYKCKPNCSLLLDIKTFDTCQTFDQEYSVTNDGKGCYYYSDNNCTQQTANTCIKERMEFADIADKILQQLLILIVSILLGNYRMMLKQQQNIVRNQFRQMFGQT